MVDTDFSNLQWGCWGLLFWSLTTVQVFPPFSFPPDCIGTGCKKRSIREPPQDSKRNGLSLVIHWVLLSWIQSMSILSEYSFFFFTEEMIPSNKVKADRMTHFLLTVHSVTQGISYCHIPSPWLVFLRGRLGGAGGHVIFPECLCAITDQQWTSAESERKSCAPLTQLCSRYSNNARKCSSAHFFPAS